jgi:hypothetical protein
MYIATCLYGTGRNRTHAYVIGALVASILAFTIEYLRYVSTPSHPILQVFGGFLLGMLSWVHAESSNEWRASRPATN